MRKKNRHCVHSAETGLLTKFAMELHRTLSVVWDHRLGGPGDAPTDSDTRRVLKNVLFYIYIVLGPFLLRVSILTRDIDIANLSVCLSVRNVPVSDENGLTYGQIFFTVS